MGTGDITIVFDTGYGDCFTSSDGAQCDDIWNGVQDEVAKYTHTIAYERSGMGKSEDTQNYPNELTDDEKTAALNGGVVKYNADDFDGRYKTARDKAINLHNLLKSSNADAPYIFVIHSISSFTMIEYAKLYPQEIAGIVIIDGTTLHNFEFYNKYFSSLGVSCLEALNDMCSDPADGSVSEILISTQQAKNDVEALRNIPIHYLESSGIDGDEVIHEMHDKDVDDLLSHTNYSTKTIVNNSSHYVHHDQKELVVNKILDMKNECEDRIKNNK